MMIRQCDKGERETLVCILSVSDEDDTDTDLVRLRLHHLGNYSRAPFLGLARVTAVHIEVSKEVFQQLHARKLFI